jgi:signal transduction histidine kinase
MSRRRILETRLRHFSERNWEVLDRALAGLLFAIMVVDLTTGHHRGPLALNILLAAALGLSLLWRRRRPLLMAIGVIAGAAVGAAVLTSPAGSSAIAVVVIVACYSTGAHLELRRALVGLALMIGTIVVISLIKAPGDLVFPVLFFGALPWGVGRVIRSQTALARELAERADREQAASEEREARAAATERARVARELHDVLAHNLSVMVIQAAAARRVVDSDPAAAVEAAELIGRTGREALSELRYLFGPVRREDGEELGASPGLANLEHLASRAHRAGLTVALHVEGEPITLPPGADMAAYRVVQEALTNTLKHAHGARATVNVRYRPSDVVVEVVDDGGRAAPSDRPPDGGGHGLVGMRERVALYGGNLDAGIQPTGGFAVRAQLPLQGVRA